MKINKKWLIAAILCVVLAIGSFVGMKFSGENEEEIENTGISTEMRNRCLLYNEENGLLFIGTHENELVTYKDGEEIWRASANGAYSEIILDDENGILYAGNEDGNIYEYQEEDGQLKDTINVQRRILAIDVSSDKTKIAAATSTGSSKANILVYDASTGEELVNNKFTIRITGVKFGEDNNSVFCLNNRGEIIHMTLDGEEIQKYSTNYAGVQLIRENGLYWAVSKDGSYVAVNDDMEVQEQGKINNDISATITSVGVNKSGDFVAVGTSEGYVFVMNRDGKELYRKDMGSNVSGFYAVDDDIWMTDMTGTVSIIHVNSIENINANKQKVNAFRMAGIILLILACIAFLGSVNKVRLAFIKLMKHMWRCRMAYIMLLPTLILIYFFNYKGIATAFVRAFTNWSKTNTTLAEIKFVGLDNFRRMFTEGYFFIGMQNLALLMITGILKTITVPVAVAWLVYSIKGDKRKYIHRFLFVLPIVVPGVISAMTWQKIYDPSIGLLNEVLGALHLEQFQRVWLGDAKTAIWAVIFMGFPFINAMAFLVYYGGLLNIGKDVEESAMIDGASRHDIFWKIQLPLLRSQIGMMVMLTIIGCMQDFNGIFILTSGGPGTATYVPALELYLNVAQFGRYGYACALGVVLFIFTMTVTLISNRLTREKE